MTLRSRAGAGSRRTPAANTCRSSRRPRAPAGLVRRDWRARAASRDAGSGVVIAAIAARITSAGPDIGAVTTPHLAPSPQHVEGNSELDAGLVLDALLVRVFDLAHLGDEIGVVDEFLRGVAAGDDDVGALGALLQEVDDLAGGEPAVGERVGELVESDDVVVARGDLLLALLPEVAGEGLVLLDVLREPGEAAAQRDDLHAYLLCRPVFAVVAGGGLDELEHADVVAAAPGAKEDAEGGGGLALAVAGVDDDERLPGDAGLGLVFMLFGHRRGTPVSAPTAGLPGDSSKGGRATSAGLPGDSSTGGSRPDESESAASGPATRSSQARSGAASWTVSGAAMGRPATGWARMRTATDPKT